ncbi:MAG: glucose-6-phosphate isomerase [Bacteroidales bacterium]|nr:glucose-6-phosphate isomerase [Candidatus Sodaliphilus aphodohippi]
MNTISVCNKNVLGVINEQQIKALEPEAQAALETLEQGTGAGSEFIGWKTLPSATPDETLTAIEQTAAMFKRDCEMVVAIGIGGSYLGAKAVIEALNDNFAAYKKSRGARVLFAGNNIGEDYMHDLMDLLAGRKFGIIVISKSGTTTEPAIAFRLLKGMLEQQEGKQWAAQHIVAVTDASRGALRNLATQEGYKTFVIPNNVGGRFSVLSPVGLLPIAVEGYDIRALMAGAAEIEKGDNTNAMTYAMTRHALYRAGRKIEILVNFEPRLHYLAEWWKQLYGESEGKDHKAIFPAAIDCTTDLHSMGQWIQDGERTIFETEITVGKQNHEVVIPNDDENLDGLNYIAGKRIGFVNEKAQQGTKLAHLEGGVPVIDINLPEISERYLGQLIYFFEKACGISGYILGINPFDQPGVEGYKRNMFHLLEKPGY